MKNRNLGFPKVYYFQRIEQEIQLTNFTQQIVTAFARWRNADGFTPQRVTWAEHGSLEKSAI